MTVRTKRAIFGRRFQNSKGCSNYSCVRTNRKSTVLCQEIEIVDSFSYLGVVFSCGGSFMQNAKYLSDKALKAMHSLFQIIKGIETPINITLQLFDSLVVFILNYGCEIVNHGNF